MKNLQLTTAALCVLCGFAASGAANPEPPEFRIDANPAGEVIKDVSKSPSFPDLGLSGDNQAPGIFNDAYLSYVRDREKTARIYRESGVWLVRPCGMFETFKQIAKHPDEDYTFKKDRFGIERCEWLHPKYNFSFYKEYGIKAIVCLNIWTASDENVTALREFLTWIVENGWADTVAGFEMCNEAFYGKDPEGYAAYWKKLLPVIRSIMPDKSIGMPLAEYCEGDPDIEAARARLLGEGKLSDDYFKANNLNRWSARAVVAMGEELTNVTHIVYHVYGAAPAYGCSYNGFLRFRRFAEMFPQVRDKRWFITEWRPWSDEDLQLQRIFHNVIWAGMYVQTSFCQKELDGFTMHELNSLSGVFYSSAHGKWNQYFDSWQNGRDLKAIAPKELRYEVSGMGTLFSLYNQGIITHPLIIGWGSRKHGTGKTGTFWESSLYNPYDAKNPDCQWTALVNPSRTSMCLLIANGSNDKLEVPVSCYGYRLLAKTHRFVTCDEEFLCAREVPGEEKPWRRLNWEVPSNGDPRDRHVVTIPPRSIGTVMIGITRWDEWWRVHIGRDLMKAAVREAGKSAPKDAEPYAECCGVEKGKPFMILPDGYPGHPEIKENLPARKLCLEIGKDPQKLDPAALEKARAEGYTVCADEQGNRAWLFKSKDIPAEQSAGLERRLKEMAGF